MGDILPLKVYVTFKMESLSFIFCKIDVLWVVPFYKIGVMSFKILGMLFGSIQKTKKSKTLM